MRLQNCLLVLLALESSGPSLPAQPTRDTVKSIAAELPFLDVSGFLPYRRFGDAQTWEGATEAVVATYQQGMRRLVDGNFPEKDLVALLKDMDAKIRTFAVIALFDREDHRHLPLFYALRDDKTKTISAPSLDRTARIAFPPIEKIGPVRLQSQTVGDVAGLAVQTYLKAAGFHAAKGDKRDLSDFEAYWQARKDCRACASWYVLKFNRASMGTSAESPPRTARIHALRKEIDRLPDPERSWVLLRFGAAIETREFGISLLLNRDDAIAAGKVIGADKLLALLEGKHVSGDPDLDPASVHLGFLPRFLLKNAAALFDPAAANRLLKLEKTSTLSAGGWWAVGAAELQPERAPAILKEAFKRFGDSHTYRGVLAEAMWRLGGPKELPGVLDWYYTPDSYRWDFHTAALVDRPKDAKKLIQAIVRDRRFTFLDWPSLLSLAPVINTQAGKVIIGEEERWKLSHPHGMYHFTQAVARPDNKFAKENEHVFKTLADWRERMEAEVATWRK